MKPNGYVLHRSGNVVVIATTKSENVKTGDMVQVWIIRSDMSPVEAVRTGLDAAVCMDCVHRGVGGFEDRSCYVNVAQAPQKVYRAFQAGSYPKLAPKDYASVFSGRAVRFGAYGEPVLIPLSIIERIAGVCTGWTGYTHQWRKARYQGYKRYLMASCDSPVERLQASLAGWRTFRVSLGVDPQVSEISCPASGEMGTRTTCEKCLLCSGVRGGDSRKDITIQVHGAGAKKAAEKLVRIGA